jgi:hypothetical protein
MLQRETAETALVRPHAARRLYRSARTAVARLTPTDRRILGLWAGAHAGLAVIAWMSAWIGGSRGLYRPLLGIYGQWDYTWYQAIAAHGYFSGRGPGSDGAAFLPGFPLVLAAVHLIVRNWVVAGLLISLVAGGVALVCIGRLGGERAALCLLTAPAAMYLIVGYSEALFLAFALPAWMAAKRRDWPLASLLAACAGLVRVNGVFLIAALMLAAVMSPRGQRLRATAVTSLAALGPAGFEIYLWAGSGSWTAWLTANRNGWGLRFVGPWMSLRNTWDRAFGHGLTPERAAMFQLEIACMAVALALTIVLTWRRAWPEALYCALAVVSLATTTYYQAVPRTLLLMWPLYVLVARAAERRPWLGQLYVWVCAPLAVVVAVLFFLGVWAV